MTRGGFEIFRDAAKLDVRKSVQDHWDECARAATRLDGREMLGWFRQNYPEWNDRQCLMAAGEVQFGDSWVRAGRITYELTHSLAALFALTSAPDISRLPHEAFAIKVPREFLPMEGSWASPDSWVAVAKRGDEIAIFSIADGNTTATTLTRYIEHVAGDDLENRPAAHHGEEKHHRLMILAGRFAANTIAYVLEHQDCVVPRPQGRSAQGRKPTYEVRPPREVTIDKEFRAAARAAVSATSLVGVRRAMRHVVRGHWRNQAVGPKRSERRRTWIRPHRRGDEALGSVIARVERIHVTEDKS